MLFQLSTLLYVIPYLRCQFDNYCIVSPAHSTHLYHLRDEYSFTHPSTYSKSHSFHLLRFWFLPSVFLFTYSTYSSYPITPITEPCHIYAPMICYTYWSQPDQLNLTFLPQLLSYSYISPTNNNYFRIQLSTNSPSPSPPTSNQPTYLPTNSPIYSFTKSTVLLAAPHLISPRCRWGDINPRNDGFWYQYLVVVKSCWIGMEQKFSKKILDYTRDWLVKM